jgi:hypothetical protein
VLELAMLFETASSCSLMAWIPERAMLKLMA